MAYNVTLSNGGSVVIPDGNIFNSYSVPLIGQNTSAYGDDVAAAFLRGLENFAFTQPPDINPNIPGSLKLTGQLWYDTLNGELNVYNGVDWAPLLTSGAGITGIAGDVLPEVDSLHDIGSTGLRWAEIWGDDIAFGGTLTAEAGSTVSVSGSFTADGSSTVNLNGSNTAVGLTMTGRLNTVAASGGIASLRLPSGTTTTTTNGDVWFDGSNLRIVVGGVQETIALVGPAGGVTSFNGRSGAVSPIVGDYGAFYTVKDGSSGTQTINSAAGWTFDNRPAFNGGSSGSTSPFTVDSNTVVANLNADLLDGNEASVFALDANVVHDTGTEQIDGNKTFGNTVRIISGTAQIMRLTGTGAGGNASQGYISFYSGSDTTEYFRLGDDSSAGNFLFDALISGQVLHRYNSDNRIIIDSGGVDLYNAEGTPAIALATQNGSNITTKVAVYDVGGTARNAGYNETPTVTLSGTTILSTTNIGKFLTRTGSGSAIVQLNQDSGIPVGGSAMVHNDNSSNSLTVTQGSGVTLQWIDGSGSAPLTGTRTIAYNGITTVRKKSLTVYQIWGNGIS